MLNWFKKKNITWFDALTIAGTVAATFVTGPIGGVITAATGLAAKLAQSPKDMPATPENVQALIEESRRLAEAIQKARK